MTLVLTNFSQRFTEALENRGFRRGSRSGDNFTDFAALIDVSGSAVSLWSRGPTLPQLPQLQKICVALDLPLEHFTGQAVRAEPLAPAVPRATTLGPHDDECRLIHLGSNRIVSVRILSVVEDIMTLRVVPGSES